MQLRCAVFRGLPKELEEEVNKFLSSTACVVHYVSQSESGDHICLTLLYDPDGQEED
jgi:hypothetical protein